MLWIYLVNGCVRMKHLLCIIEQNVEAEWAEGEEAKARLTWKECIEQSKGKKKEQVKVQACLCREFLSQEWFGRH